MAGASKIIAVDINPDKFEAARKLGATDCVDSSSLDIPVQQYMRDVFYTCVCVPPSLLGWKCT